MAPNSDADGSVLSTLLLILAVVATVMVVGFVALAIDSSQKAPPESADNTTVEPATDVPGNVSSAKTVGVTLYDETVNLFDSVRVFISQDGEIALHYQTQQETPEAVESELFRIADLYADVVQNESQATTLSIVTGEVQAVVPESSLRAHIDGKINREAFLETVEIIGVDSDE